MRRTKGTGTILPEGYLRFEKNGKGILEHRMIMEEHLGRPLTRSETIHHKNGNRLDNRVENLELWNSSHPAGQRADDLVQWAREILALYT